VSSSRVPKRSYQVHMKDASVTLTASRASCRAICRSATPAARHGTSAGWAVAASVRRDHSSVMRRIPGRLSAVGRMGRPRGWTRGGAAAGGAVCKNIDSGRGPGV